MEILIVAVLGLVIFFIPCFIAIGKKNFISVLVINLFLGWTFVGWVVAFALSLRKD